MAKGKGENEKPKLPGIYRKAANFAGKPQRVADLSYHANDCLAQFIVNAWVDEDFREQLLDRNDKEEAVRIATASVRACGLYVNRAVVISEKEYNEGFDIATNEVAFVLPDVELVEPRPSQSLLETARLLMACTPHGI
jgi:hypothetical protein